MKFLKFILLTSLFLSSSFAQSESKAFFEGSLNQLLNHYSKISETDFVIDSSVKGKATLEGIEHFDSRVIASILDVHGYSAVEKNGKVHVLPSAMAEKLIQNGGVLWGNL